MDGADNPLVPVTFPAHYRRDWIRPGPIGETCVSCFYCSKHNGACLLTLKLNAEPRRSQSCGFWEAAPFMPPTQLGLALAPIAIPATPSAASRQCCGTCSCWRAEPADPDFGECWSRDGRETEPTEPVRFPRRDAFCEAYIPKR